MLILLTIIADTVRYY